MDENGEYIRAKYKVVVLGNLDPRNWTENNYFAPMMSQLEFRFPIALVVQMKIKPRQEDSTQDFCQSTLPINEIYVCSPIHNCLITPKNTYLFLKKRLYSLKISPRHWY